jgi:hypothetical protein
MLLIAVFVLSSCSKSSQKNAKFIPDNAAVISIDVKQIIEKSKIADNADAKKKLQATMEEGVKNQETKNLIKKIMEDPTKAGIDLTEPIFVFFADNNDKQAAVATISSKDDFLELANALQKEDGGEPVKEKDGIQYIQDGKTVVAFDDAAFFISESYSLDDVIAKFKNDDTKGTMAESEDFAKLTAAQGFIKALIPMTLAEGQITKNMLPEGAELKDLSVLIDLSTDKGEAKFGFECLAKSDAWKNYIKQSADMCGKIAGDYLKYLPKGAFMLYTNINGKKLYEAMEKNGVLAGLGAADQQDIVKKILEAIEGDFAIGVGEFKGNLPDAAAYIKTKDGSIIDFAKENGMKPEKGIDFGFKDGASFVAIGENNAAFTEVKGGFDKSVVSGRRLYLFCDIDLISTLTEQFSSSAASNAKMAGEHLKTIEFYDTSDTSGELVLKLDDEGKDPVQYIIDMALSQF